MRDLFEEIHADLARHDPVERAKELSRRELPKRFYTEVAVAETDGGFAVTLDGRQVKTPARKPFLLPSRPLAEAAAAEWAAQESVINPGLMPLTRLANAAIDAVSQRFAEVADEIARYAGNDALCYRAEEPERLAERQRLTWDPLLEAASGLLGHRFRLAGGVLHVAQDPALTAAYRALVGTVSPLELAALHTVTTITGSAVLALLLARGVSTPDQIWAAAHVDEDWNAELWGEDAEASRIRAYKRQEFDAATLILRG
ncbi:ATPase [Microvirga tunisiensis]|uniref:ATPase n=2 Tax=Pannonibacter tanglangensis TaxID=2750084 RepID=A0ABW9ZFT5_9HYPH|nr:MULTISPECIES: ATP12 family protein [unclassified Pannonibacter]NBN63713.1 ATPase [Pannonibacter sp. XCT-34]NBN77360.1 ATPase [Pannonibacter sp. XCT-53]